MANAQFDWLPAGLASNAAQQPTGGWVHKRPDASEFHLAPNDLDRASYTSASRWLGGLGWVTVTLAAAVVVGTVAAQKMGYFDQTMLKVLLVAEAAIALAVYWRSSAPFAKQMNSYHAAGSRRDKFKKAQAKFAAEIEPWRKQQTDAQYWTALEPGAPFEQAVADLMLGLFPHGAATLIAGEGEREADIVAAAGQAKIVVRCRTQDEPVGLDELRRLAAAKLFFRADVAILAARTFDETPPMKDYADRCGLTLWDANALAEIATSLDAGRDAPLPRAKPITVTEEQAAAA